MNTERKWFQKKCIGGWPLLTMDCESVKIIYINVLLTTISVFSHVTVENYQSINK